jgi:sugar/nucleoside kinase (ribokinase family)
MEITTPHYLIAGQLTRDFIILPNGKALLDTPGGNALYVGIGLRVWEAEAQPAIVARVGEDYPQQWLENFANWGLNTRGVRILPESVDVRSFVAFPDPLTRSQTDPVAHFARLELPFPKALLGFRPPGLRLDSRIQLQTISLRQGDIPSDFLNANIAHLCPVDYLTHSLLPALLRQAEFTTVTLDPSPGYMNPTFWDDIPALLNGLTAFLPSEEEIRSLFQGRSTDLWEMAEALTIYGCDFIVIKRGPMGQLFYDKSTRTRWEIPPYPARLSNPIGAGDAFCGGFLAGYHKTYDPLQAVMHGNIAASLVIEGDPPNYALDALPGLAEARLRALNDLIRKI